MEKQGIVVFESEDGEVRLDVGFDGQTVWLTQAQMASLFMTTKQNVSLHANNCFKEGELDKESVVKECLTTAKQLPPMGSGIERNSLILTLSFLSAIALSPSVASNSDVGPLACCVNISLQVKLRTNDALRSWARLCK